MWKVTAAFENTKEHIISKDLSIYLELSLVKCLISPILHENTHGKTGSIRNMGTNAFLVYPRLIMSHGSNSQNREEKRTVEHKIRENLNIGALIET